MKFTIILFIISKIIGLSVKTNKNIRELIRYKRHRIVITTREWDRGVRFLISEGKFGTDRVLDEYDMALVWKDSDIAFKTLTSKDPVGLPKAIANRDLELRGNRSLWVWFTIFLGYATGVLKRK